MQTAAMDLSDATAGSDVAVMVATSRYQSAALIVESGLAPVRITLGAPRFKLGYELAGDVRTLAPTPKIFKLRGDGEFEAAFQERLDALDARAVWARLAAIAVAADAPGVVLLCFEDVWKGEKCHRRQVAAWLERESGQYVRELRSGDVEAGQTVDPYTGAVRDIPAQ